MLKYKINGIDISINLNNGVYTFYGYSGEGKSYLAFLLKELRKQGYNVDSYSYLDDVAYSSNVYNILSNSNNVLVFIDRLDMFINEELSIFINSIKDKIILLDYKHEIYEIPNLNYCSIEYCKGRINIES